MKNNIHYLRLKLIQSFYLFNNYKYFSIKILQYLYQIYQSFKLKKNWVIKIDNFNMIYHFFKRLSLNFLFTKLKEDQLNLFLS